MSTGRSTHRSDRFCFPFYFAHFVIVVLCIYPLCLAQREAIIKKGKLAIGRPPFPQKSCDTCGKKLWWRQSADFFFFFFVRSLFLISIIQHLHFIFRHSFTIMSCSVEEPTMTTAEKRGISVFHGFASDILLFVTVFEMRLTLEFHLCIHALPTLAKSRAVHVGFCCKCKTTKSTIVIRYAEYCE